LGANPAGVRREAAAVSRGRRPSARLTEVLYAPESELLVLRFKDRIMPATRNEYRRKWAVAAKPSRSVKRSALAVLATMLAVVSILLVAAGTAAPSTPQPAGALSAPPNWKLAFSTDFPGSPLDTSTWAE